MFFFLRTEWISTFLMQTKLCLKSRKGNGFLPICSPFLDQYSAFDRQRPLFREKKSEFSFQRERLENWLTSLLRRQTANRGSDLGSWEGKEGAEWKASKGKHSQTAGCRCNPGWREQEWIKFEIIQSIFPNMEINYPIEVTYSTRVWEFWFKMSLFCPSAREIVSHILHPKNISKKGRTLFSHYFRECKEEHTSITFPKTRKRDSM